MSRSTVNPLRLPRIESPTNRAPTMTAVAIATPRDTATVVLISFVTEAIAIRDSENGRVDMGVLISEVLVVEDEETRIQEPTGS